MMRTLAITTAATLILVSNLVTTALCQAPSLPQSDGVPATQDSAADDGRQEATTGSQVSGEDKPVSFWMEKKMEYTQQILRGLASGELQRVRENAVLMQRLAKIEGWMRRRNEGYAEQLQTFQLATKEIIRQAESEDLQGTTMGFHHLTSSCVSCHALLRDEVPLTAEVEPAKAIQK